MAKNKGKAKKASKNNSARKDRGIRYYIWLFACIAASVVFISTTVMLAFGMIPTLVAIFIDKSKERAAGMAVGAMNLAGCFPFLLDLWQTDMTLRAAYDILFDPLTLLVMYSAAAVGWIIYFNVPPIVSMFLVRRYEKRIKAFEKRLAQLEEMWGPEVRGREEAEEDALEEIEEEITADDAESSKGRLDAKKRSPGAMPA